MISNCGKRCTSARRAMPAGARHRRQPRFWQAGCARVRCSRAGACPPPRKGRPACGTRAALQRWQGGPAGQHRPRRAGLGRRKGLDRGDVCQGGWPGQSARAAAARANPPHAGTLAARGRGECTARRHSTRGEGMSGEGHLSSGRGQRWFVHSLLPGKGPSRLLLATDGPRARPADARPGARRQQRGQLTACLG